MLLNPKPAGQHANAAVHPASAKLEEASLKAPGPQ